VKKNSPNNEAHSSEADESSRAAAISFVAAVKCADYDPCTVKNALERAILLLGGPSQFVKAGERIVLKPNLLLPAKVEEGVTTHPSIFRAAAEIFLQAGAVITWGDSPGFGSAETVARKCGILDAARGLNISEADFKTAVEVHHTHAVQNKKLFLAKGAVEADGVISLPRMKTHGMTRITCAIKNQFGCVPGLAKAEYHLKLPDISDFSRMLVDVCSAVNPRLYILDAVYAMEGNGPRSGINRPLGLILVSADPVALDSTVCRLMSVDVSLVPMLAHGESAGLGNFRPEKIQYLGDDITPFIRKSFDADRSPLIKKQSGNIMKFFRKNLTPRPVIIKKKCISCGRCIEACPLSGKAIYFADEKKIKKQIPCYNYSLCIRCFCCQEMCPEGAIKIHYNLFRRGIRAAENFCYRM